MALPILTRHNDRDQPSALFYAGSFALSTVVACSSLYAVNAIAGLLWIPVQYAIQVIWCKEAIPISLVVVLIAVGVWTQPELVEEVKGMVAKGWGKGKETGNKVTEAMPAMPAMPSMPSLGYHPEEHPNSPRSTSPSSPTSPTTTNPTALKTKKHHFHRHAHAESQKHADREEAKQMKRAEATNEKVERMAARAQIVEHSGTVGKEHLWTTHHEKKHEGALGKNHEEQHREGEKKHDEKHHEEHSKHHETGLGVVHEEESGNEIAEDGKPYAKAHFGLMHHQHLDGAEQHGEGSTAEAVQEPSTGRVAQEVDGRVAVGA